MISINNLSYLIGDRPLYDNASLHIKPKDKIGLIGLNGTGKSTLLKLINGEYQASQGEISKSKDCTIGFLNQDLLSFQSDESIVAVTLQAFKDVLETQSKIDKVLKEMEDNYHDKLVDKLTKLQERFETMGGYTVQSRAEEILEGVGFTTSDLMRPLKEFSGGWRMRVMLAKLLLEKPSLLMLDEPTNHLDLPSIIWIEDYLRSYEGAVIVVSHDREFLNNTVSKIVEVSGRSLTPYEGNYDFYLQEKALREEIQQNAFENQQQKIKQTERFITRFRAKASKARQVQSKIKSLERMDRIDEVVDANASINFKFDFQQKPGRFIVQLEEINKAYGDNEVIKDTTLNIEREDKIALIGANGKGKSTLLRIVAGSEQFGGKRQPGYNVNSTFYAQHQLEALTLSNKILEELSQAGSGKSELELRNLLGCFLFTEDDVFKKIKVLSGGEKSRVALAKTLISEANFLILDEPTNHLDILSENILIQALQQYNGSFVIVSHNRHFISQVANKIWYIENKVVKEYLGSYEEYEYWVKNVKSSPTQAQTDKKVEKRAKPKKSVHTASSSGSSNRSMKEKELEKVEQEIERLDLEKETLESEMSKPEVFGDHEKLAGITSDYENVKAQLENLHSQWEEIANVLDALSE